MLSLTAHTQIPSSNHRVSCLKAPLFPALISAGKSKKRDNNWQKSLKFGFQLAEERREVKPGINLGSSWCYGGEGEVELEAEIMNFMAKSEKPWMFPTKEELILAGRFDLVRAIKKRGNRWYSLGWDVENGAEETTYSGSNSLDSSSQQPAVDQDSGIDGILSRLEKQRNSQISALKLAKNLGFGGTEHEANSRNGNITEPETWMSRRARFPLAEFEEISLGKNPVVTDKESYRDGITVATKEHAKDLDQHKEIGYNEVYTRLRCLDAVLAAAVRSIPSKRVDTSQEKVSGSSSELQTLSDAVEFHENELMSAKQRLRSLRAKLAVAEGKTSLAIIESQSLAEVKQKRMKDSRKSLQLLRAISIVLPNPAAAEVLLTGSFDGWKTRRRMRRSKSGVFSITLKLYPGRYEIKFIVDGKWKLDPLRSIVKNKGHKNNLLLVT